MEAGLYSKGDLPEVQYTFEDVFNERETDFEIRCQGGKLKAHKAVLSARSPVFKNVIHRHPQDNYIQIDTTVHIMAKVLRIMYAEVVQILLYEKWFFVSVISLFCVDYWCVFKEVPLDADIPMKMHAAKLIGPSFRSPLGSSADAGDESSAATTPR